MAIPEEYSNDESKKRWTHYFVSNAAHIPRLLQRVQARSKDLDTLLEQLYDTISSTPSSAFASGNGSMVEAVVELLNAGILGTLVTILLSKKWYTGPSQRQGPTTLNLQVRTSRFETCISLT